MNQVFKSKIDSWLFWILVISVGASVWAGFYVLFVSRQPADQVAALFTMLIGAGLPVWIMSTTFYTVEDGKLTIQSGPFSFVILLSEIESVEETNNPLSSPALSLDRLLIKYRGGKRIMVSPKDKSEFRRAIGK